MAKAKAFFDTNILFYSDDSRNPSKQKNARELIELHFAENTGAISMQVLQEYFYQATSKLKLDLDTARSHAFFFSHFLVLQPSIDDFRSAIDLHHLHRISFWDAMILRMALLSGARVLYTEDLQHGRRFDHLQIVNPFL